MRNWLVVINIILFLINVVLLGLNLAVLEKNKNSLDRLERIEQQPVEKKERIIVV